MNWNQEELEQWALAAKQKEEDNQALQKFTRADEAKVQCLTWAIARDGVLEQTLLLSVTKGPLDDKSRALPHRCR